MYVFRVEMGSARARDRRAGMRREGPVERASIELAQERARERQRDSRRRRRENASTSACLTQEEGSLSEADNASTNGVNRRLVRRDVAAILSCVHMTLRGRGRLLPHKQAVMWVVWNSPITKELLPPGTRRVCNI